MLIQNDDNDEIYVYTLTLFDIDEDDDQKQKNAINKSKTPIKKQKTIFFCRNDYIESKNKRTNTKYTRIGMKKHFRRSEHI